MTINELETSGLSTDNLLSQCYDGAPVMSGKDGGVQALIQKQLKRKIPYVHCSNHRLHLVVVKCLECEDRVQQFFDHCSTLYNFFKKSKVRNFYNGQQIVRLLPQRWSGHYDITKIIYANFKNILNCLETVREKREEFDSEDIVTSEGLLKVMKKFEFRFLLVLMKRVLGYLEPAEKSLQSRESSLTDGLGYIKILQSSLEEMRNDDCYLNLKEEANDLGSVKKNDLKSSETASSRGNAVGDSGTAELQKSKKAKMDNLKDANTGTPILESPRQQRPRKQNSKLKGFIITAKIGQSTAEANDPETSKRLFYSVIDIVSNELKFRFSDNQELIQALQAAEDLDETGIHYLENLGVKIPSEEEFKMLKKFLNNFSTESDNTDIFEKIYKQKNVFEDTYNLLAAVKVFACGTALCESVFSVLTAIDSARRRSMSHARQADLVYLAFEKKRTEAINLDQFLHHFNAQKKRRLQLF